VCQPFESGARPSAAAADGAVASYLNWTALVALVVFPARSRHVPVPVALDESGPAYENVQKATPETASTPLNASASGARNHPDAFGLPTGAPFPEINGGVASTLKTGDDDVVVPPWLVTEHDRC
jgi:hypothetical protein